MPYRNCPDCRLTTYSAARYSTKDSCPRCGASLEAAPRSLFELRRSADKRNAETPHSLVSRALVGTGFFRDRRRSLGGRSTRSA